MKCGLFLEGVVVLSTLIGFNDPDSPEASTFPAQAPVSAPAPVMLQQGQSPDHHSPSPVAHPSPSLSPGMAPSAGSAPSATPLVAPGQSDGVALDGDALPGYAQGCPGHCYAPAKGASHPAKHSHVDGLSSLH